MDAPRGSSRLLAYNAGVAVVYGIVGTLSLLAVRDTGLASPVWPAAGLAFAFVFQYGWRLAPGVAIGSLLVNVPTVIGSDKGWSAALAVGAAIAVGAALQAALGSGLVRRFVSPHPALVTPQQILLFLVFAGPVACVVNPTFGLTAQLLGGVIEPEQSVMVWLTWWVGDSIGVIVFASIVLMLLPEQEDVWRGRRLKVAIPSLVVLALSSWLFLQNAGQELDRADQRVKQIATETRAELQGDLERQQESLQGIGSFVSSSDFIDRDEFATFTRGTLERETGLQALSWNPVISRDELGLFELRQRMDQGMPDFAVTERDSAGELVTVAPRDTYVPVEYIEPLADNAAAVGFDIASNPVRAEAIDRARATGLVAATAPIDLVQETGTQKGVLVLQPVFLNGENPASPTARRLALTGFAVGVYRLQDLMDRVFAAPRWAGLGITLTDVTPGQEPVVVAQHVMDGPPAPLPAVTQDIEIGGRTWQIAVALSRTSGAWTTPTAAPAILVGGLVISLLLEAFLLLLTGTERQARRDAEVHGYQANHDSLTDLYNRRAFIDRVDAARKRAEAEASRHVLLFMDLDGFKAVNDSGGHEMGDEMLRGVAEQLRSQVRERDIVARLGGDEFGAILNNCPVDRGLRIAQSLVDAVEAYRLPSAPEGPSVGLSVGVAMIDGAEPATVDELIRRADAACYEAKHAGKNQVRLFEATPTAPSP